MRARSPAAALARVALSCGIIRRIHRNRRKVPCVCWIAGSSLANDDQCEARACAALPEGRAPGGTGLAGGLELPALLVDGAVGLRRLEDEGVVVLGVRARPVGALVVAAAQVFEVIPAVADQADQVFDRRALELQPGPAAELAEQDRMRERTVHVILVAVGAVR